LRDSPGARVMWTTWADSVSLIILASSPWGFGALSAFSTSTIFIFSASTKAIEIFFEIFFEAYLSRRRIYLWRWIW